MNILNYELFLERKNYTTLYHIVDYNKLKFILDNNVIKSKAFAYISLTREKMMNSYLGAQPTTFFKLEIDGNLLTTKYKIVPFSYKADNGSHFEEFEEQVRTHSIENAFKYIKKVIIIKSAIDRMLKSHKEITTLGYFTTDGTINGTIVDIIKTIKAKCDEKNIPLYVQIGSVIKQDNEYIDSLINFKLQTQVTKYATALRGDIRMDKINRPLFIDENGNKMLDPVIGHSYSEDEMPFKLYDNIEDIPELPLPPDHDNYKIYPHGLKQFILKFILKTKSGHIPSTQFDEIYYYLKNFKPYS